jgi:hypothetical protein
MVVPQGGEQGISTEAAPSQESLQSAAVNKQELTDVLNTWLSQVGEPAIRKAVREEVQSQIVKATPDKQVIRVNQHMIKVINKGSN